MSHHLIKNLKYKCRRCQTVIREELVSGDISMRCVKKFSYSPKNKCLFLKYLHNATRSIKIKYWKLVHDKLSI